MKVLRWSFFQVVMPGSGRIFLEDCGLEYLFELCRGRAAYFSRIPASNTYFRYVGVGLDIFEDSGLEYLF